MRPFSFCLHAILFCYYQILYCIIGRRGRFTNLSTPFFHVYLSGTYPRCVRQLVEHRGHRPRTLPLPLRLLGGVPRILQLPCLVDRTARPVSRLVDVPRRARRSRTAQPRTRAPLRRGVAAPYPVGNLHDGLLYERYERVKGMASFLSDDCAVGPEDAAAAVEAQLAGDADYRAQAFAFTEGFVCFQQSFSRLGNSNKFDCARLIENVQINLTLPSLIRIFDCVLDTPSRHNQACACFCARLFVSLSSKPDSGRPRSVDDASATDAASGSQKRRSWDSTR